MEDEEGYTLGYHANAHVGHPSYYVDLGSTDPGSASDERPLINQELVIQCGVCFEYRASGALLNGKARRVCVVHLRIQSVTGVGCDLGTSNAVEE
jgi:hypothetical protein